MTNPNLVLTKEVACADPALNCTNGVFQTTTPANPLKLLRSADGTMTAAAQYRFRVTNTGAVRGAETVQCYVHDAESSVSRPQQELKAFAKVWLDPGDSREIRLPLGGLSFFSQTTPYSGRLADLATSELKKR